MTVVVPSFVAPNELIQSAWGNGVVNAIYALSTERLRNDTSDEMAGTLTVNRPSTGTSLILKQGAEEPSARWQSQAGTDLLSVVATATEVTVNTLNANPFNVLAPASFETPSGSTALSLRAVTETPVLVLESTAGTDLLALTGSSSLSRIAAFDNLALRANGTDVITIDGGTEMVTTSQGLTTGAGLTVGTFATIDGTIDHNGSLIGLYGATPVAQSGGWGAPTGTATKTTFATSTVTLEQLAQRVKALLDFLLLRGDLGT